MCIKTEKYKCKKKIIIRRIESWENCISSLSYKCRIYILKLYNPLRMQSSIFCSKLWLGMLVLSKYFTHIQLTEFFFSFLTLHSSIIFFFPPVNHRINKFFFSKSQNKLFFFSVNHRICFYCDLLKRKHFTFSFHVLKTF